MTHRTSCHNFLRKNYFKDGAIATNQSIKEVATHNVQQPGAILLQGSLYYPPKQCTMKGKSLKNTQNCHAFALIPPTRLMIQRPRFYDPCPVCFSPLPTIFRRNCNISAALTLAKQSLLAENALFQIGKRYEVRWGKGHVVDLEKDVNA